MTSGAGDYILALVAGYGSFARERRSLMILTAYVDDSGSEPSAKTFVLAGFMLPTVPQTHIIEGRTIPSWIEFSNEWETVLRLPRELEYLKMSEVWDRKKGPFVGWSDTERSDKVYSLAAVIPKHTPMGLSVSVEWEQYEAFKREYVMPRDKDNPYFFLFYRIIALMTQVGKRRNNPTPVDFVFDEQNKIGIKTREWYYFFRDHVSIEYRQRLGDEPMFKDEKKVVALQAADMFAWFLRRKADSMLLRPQQQEILVSLRACLAAESEPLTVEILKRMATELRVGRERSKANTAIGNADEFARFDRTMRALISVPHSEIKARLEAEKAAKAKKRKAKKPSASDRAASDKG